MTRKNRPGHLRITSLEGYSLRDLWKIAKAVSVFNRNWRRSAPEQQEAMLAFLASQPGVTVTRTTEGEADR